jgi:hypothetical protein
MLRNEYDILFVQAVQRMGGQQLCAVNFGGHLKGTLLHKIYAATWLSDLPGLLFVE